MTFSGDSKYKVNATGDCCVGDCVRFERAVFTGSHRKPKFSHYDLVTGEIVADSYGAEKQQHTFTLRLSDGRSTRIKGRNLYRNGVWREVWPNEARRRSVLDEKHYRGAEARAAREERECSL